MITTETIDQLREISRRIKDLLPDVNGNVQMNIAKDQPDPKVTVSLYDVTKEEKK